MYNTYSDVINYTIKAFHNNNDKTTPKPIPTAIVPALSKCIDIPPTNAPNNTAIIIQIHK